MKIDVTRLSRSAVRYARCDTGQGIVKSAEHYRGTDISRAAYRFRVFSALLFPQQIVY